MSISFRVKMCLRLLPSALPFIGLNVRQFYSKIRLDMNDDNVVLDQVSKNSYDINFIRIGNGSKAIILMPGAIGTIETDFQPQINGLPKLLTDYTIVSWDPPGYGKSRPPERTFPVGFYHRDAYLADSLMRRLGFDQYSIVGWSDGGTTGLIMASCYPETVKKLVIWGSGPIMCPIDVEICQSI